VIAWRPSDAENLVSPHTAALLIERAMKGAPGDATLNAKLGRLHLDRFDFARAALAFEAAHRGDPSCADVRLALARCWNRLGRHSGVLTLLGGSQRSLCAHGHLQHGTAFAALGRGAEADLSFRSALDLDPHHALACFELSKILRRAGRHAEMLSLCEALAGKGAAHTQLLVDWGRALAHNGQPEEAARLLFDLTRLARSALPVPPGFSSLESFNIALAEELMTNANAITEVPTDEIAMRGSVRVQNLMNGRRPDLIRKLFAGIEAGVEAYVRKMTSAADAVDPWFKARPAHARLHAWGLIQKSGDYEEWHTHRGGWLSGVYYSRIPERFSVTGTGAGCIEFGPPPSLTEAGISLFDPVRVAPCEGLLLLAPSHYHHRTIPFISDGLRICVPFDVRRIDPGAAE